MLTKKVEKSLNRQIELEANASQFYLAMASWAETKGKIDMHLPLIQFVYSVIFLLFLLT